MAVRPARKPGTTEQRICDAAEKLLQHVRAVDLTVEEILAEAGISRRTFYSYFTSKYDVISRLALRTLGEAYPEQDPFFAGATRAKQRAALEVGITRACAVWAEHRAVLSAVIEHWRDVPELREIWLGVIDRFTDDMAAQIETQRLAGAAPAGADSRRIAQTLIWSGAYTIYLAGLPESAHIPDEHSVVEMLVNGWAAAVYGR